MLFLKFLNLIQFETLHSCLVAVSTKTELLFLLIFDIINKRHSIAIHPIEQGKTRVFDLLKSIHSFSDTKAFLSNIKLRCIELSGMDWHHWGEIYKIELVHSHHDNHITHWVKKKIIDLFASFRRHMTVLLAQQKLA